MYKIRLNLKLMQQLYQLVAYNLAKSRAARDGNRTLKRKNFRPTELKLNGLVLVRDHTSKAFEPKAVDHHIIDFNGKNRVLVKDNHGNTKKVHKKDVQPVKMDIAMAEFFRKEREKSTIRDAQHVIPIKQIPDLNWKFDENINQVEAVETEETEEAAETVETIPEMICTTEIIQETEDLQRKRSPCMPTPPGSTPNTPPTKLEIQKSPTMEDESKILSTVEQATQITPTTEQATETTLQTPQVNNFLVAKILLY